MPGIAPGAEDTAANKTDSQKKEKKRKEIPWPSEADVVMNETTNT